MRSGRLAGSSMHGRLLISPKVSNNYVDMWVFFATRADRSGAYHNNRARRKEQFVTETETETKSKSGRRDTIDFVHIGHSHRTTDKNSKDKNGKITTSKHAW